MRTQLTVPVTWMALALAGAALTVPAAPRAASAQVLQSGDSGAKPGKKKNGKRPKGEGEKEKRVSRFFEGQEALPPLVITANFGRLRRDRGEDPPWRWGSIAYAGADGKQVTLPVRLRTRGIWRRKNCVMPPLRVDFARKETKGTVFDGQNKPKLVVHCRDEGEADQYLLKELLAYRVYRLLTPVSHRARVARVQYVDSASGKQVAERYALFVESTEEMVDRLHGQELKQQGAMPDDLGADDDALFGLFQYFVGNTDFSVAALHNVELVARDTAVVPVAYDFDWTGLVNARYAAPDPRVGVRTVRERVFRGYCGSAESFQRAVQRFDEQRGAIYALLTDSVGQLMDKRSVEESKDYFDDFYQVVDDPHRFKREVLDRCLGR